MICPRRALWREVLLIGLEDAAGDYEPGWIGSRDFATVCILAGFEPDFVRDRWRAGLIDVQPRKGACAPPLSKPRKMGHNSLELQRSCPRNSPKAAEQHRAKPRGLAASPKHETRRVQQCPPD